MIKIGKLYVAGMGPGSFEGMTVEAIKAINSCDTIVGYTKYIDLAKNYFPEKEFHSTGMRQEAERCHYAADLVKKGHKVALICSGDAGVYGLAELMLTIAEEYEIDVEVVSGVTAALSGAAVLGAPINHDFCTISLSDQLTPWAVIEKRLRAAAMGDFCICLYNPQSYHRPDTLRNACDVLLETLSPDTACGYARNIARDGQEHGTMKLSELRVFEADMFTTIFVGNSETKIRNNKLITPRGYGGKL